MEELKYKLLNRSIVTEKGCWEWQGSRVTGGYGNLTYKGKTLYTHRLSWEIHFGPIPEGLCVLHDCDNRCCVNPEHLFLGTYQDNHDDMHAKGRANHRQGAILTDEQVREIKGLLAGGLHSQYQIGDMFGVSRSTILNIHLGHNWRHI